MDDILLILSDLASSIPRAMDIIEKFTEISGYRIKSRKSEITPISAGCSLVDIGTFPFAWMPSEKKKKHLLTTIIRLTTDTVVYCPRDSHLQINFIF